jgi:hypothetical protein
MAIEEYPSGSETVWEGIHGRRGRQDVRIEAENIYTFEQTNAWLAYLGLELMLPGETFDGWLERRASDRTKGEDDGPN